MSRCGDGRRAASSLRVRCRFPAPRRSAARVLARTHAAPRISGVSTQKGVSVWRLERFCRNAARDNVTANNNTRAANEASAYMTEQKDRLRPASGQRTAPLLLVWGSRTLRGGTGRRSAGAERRRRHCTGGRGYEERGRERDAGRGAEREPSWLTWGCPCPLPGTRQMKGGLVTGRLASMASAAQTGEGPQVFVAQPRARLWPAGRGARRERCFAVLAAHLSHCTLGRRAQQPRRRRARGCCAARGVKTYAGACQRVSRPVAARAAHEGRAAGASGGQP
ncbi:MAG: hypothetical protein J3K34DRAFT_98969 [Monoraphidium minutum]|nr:MAG: hypothetical protein J3K34DRAFT_98969 [Monoraphidium minutum]